MIFAMLGYKKLGKFLDMKGIVISIIISIVMVFVADKMAWALEIQKAYVEAGENVTFFDVYNNFDYIIDSINVEQEEDLWATFYGELMMGYLLSVLASCSYIIREIKSAKTDYKIVKLQ